MNVTWHCDQCGGPADKVAVRRGTVMIPILRTPACAECFDDVEADLKAGQEPFFWLDAKEAASNQRAAAILCVAMVMER